MGIILVSQMATKMSSLETVNPTISFNPQLNLLQKAAAFSAHENWNSAE